MRSESGVITRAFVDTNLFVYAYDKRDPVKRNIALQLIRALADAGQLVISAQVLNEFCAVVLRSRTDNIAHRFDLLSLVDEMTAAADVIPLTPQTTKLALEVMAKHSLSFWDALIYAAAKEAGASVIYTEDFTHGYEIEGVRYLNPFAVTP